MSTVKRACDPCHRRKIRCDDRENSCRNCSQSGLACTFNAIPRKKGPKGTKAKVISELRQTQQQSELMMKVRQRVDSSGTWELSSVLAKGTLSAQLVNACVDFFFANLYPTMPILHRESLENAATNIGSSPEIYCLFSSLCAFILIQPGIAVPGVDANVSGTALLEETLHLRKSYNYVEHTTLATVTTSFLLFGCYFGLNKHNTAWFHLREATTLAEILGMQHESTYQNGYVPELSRKRRLYWLLFVTERAYALQRHRPLTLHATIELPTLEDDPSERATITGFLHLVSLFRPFDDVFVGLWNKSKDDCSPAWLAQLQQQVAEALPACLDGTETQTADLRISQQWLRTLVWQLSIGKGCLSSKSAQPSMTFKYPIEIARDLAKITGQLSPQAMEVHGIGFVSWPKLAVVYAIGWAIVEKLFDVACTLTDVMACVPIDATTFEIGARDYLYQFMKLVSTLRGGDSRFSPLLLAKVQATLPSAFFLIPSALPSGATDDSTDDDNLWSSSPDLSEYGSPPPADRRVCKYLS